MWKPVRMTHIELMPTRRSNLLGGIGATNQAAAEGAYDEALSVLDLKSMFDLAPGLTADLTHTNLAPGWRARGSYAQDRTLGL